VSVWEGLQGQERATAQLRRSIERGRVPHAYLFSGPPGAPLVDAAIALAMAMSCQRAPGDGCDADRSPGHAAMCDACAKIASGIHPDIVTLVREGAAQIIPIESVRTQVIARVGFPPLEEPPSRTMFVLCTTAPEQLLPTIRSRCQRVRFAAGTTLPVDADPARAERVAALGAELASDGPEPSLPARIAEAKGDAAPVLVAAARALHVRAHAAATAGDPALARRAGSRAQAILAWHTAVAVHNANPQLAIEALLSQLRGLPAVGPA